MYVPGFYRNDQIDEIAEVIKNQNFGILVSTGAERRITASHLPFHVKQNSNELILTAHLSAANPQWKKWKENEEVLIIFQGPHTYISSSWYDHVNVPTWNYIAVHIYGNITFLNEEQTIQHLDELLSYHEKREPSPVSLQSMGMDYVKKEMKGLKAIQITSTEIRSAFKLSQNRNDTNLELIMAELNKRGDENSLAIAEAMKGMKYKKH
jgi:transcriptional regulator